MRTLVAVLTLGALSFAASPIARVEASGPSVAPTRAVTPPSPARSIDLPCEFERNLGQTADEVDFVARCRGYVAFLTRGDAVVRTGAEAIRLHVTGGRDAEPVVTRSRPGRSRHFVGSNAVIDAPHAAEVAYRGVLPGVDVVWRTQARELAFDLHLDAGTDAGAVRMTIEGANRLRPDAAGTLSIGLPSGGTAHLSAPRAWQDDGAVRRPVEVAFAEGTRADEFGFSVGPHDPALPLVIDPSLLVSTLFGSVAGSDTLTSVRTDASGYVYVCGQTWASDYPTSSGAFQSAKGDANLTDGFITKLDPSCSSVTWSAYFGGTSHDLVWDVAIAGSGDVFAGGQTSSTNFPLRNAWQSTPAKGFVARIAASGASLVWSTYYAYAPRNIGLDSSGNVRCFSLQANGVQSQVFAFNSAGTKLVMSVALNDYFSGQTILTFNSFAVLPNGDTWIGGNAGNSFQNITTAGAFQSTYGGGNSDGCLTRVDAFGSVVYRSYVGGNDIDEITAICVDPAGNLCVGGTTRSASFPVVNAAQNSIASFDSAFVMKLNPAGSAALFSTYLGGISSPGTRAIAANGAGEVFVAGDLGGPTFPVLDAFQPVAADNGDSFVTGYNAQGAMLYSSFLGGTRGDTARALAVSAGGGPIVAGSTGSTDFPTFAGLSSKFTAPADLFVTGVATAADRPTKPIQLVAEYRESGEVALSWKDTSSFELGFRVERKPDLSPFSFLGTTPSNLTSLTDSLVARGTTYTYRVRAFSAIGDSAWSNEAVVTIPVPPSPGAPLEPADLRADVLLDRTVALSWTDRSADEEGFFLERADGGLPFAPLALKPANSVSHVDRSVHPGWPYLYRVSAESQQGVSPPSNAAAATVPATIELEVRSGTLVEGRRPLRSAVRFSATITSEVGVPDPVADGLDLVLGFTTSPVRVSIPSGDAGWKVKTKAARKGQPARVVGAAWRSPRGASPRVSVSVDLARGTVRASVSAVTLAPLTDNPSIVRVLLASGAAGGAHAASWTESRRGVFKFAAK